MITCPRKPNRVNDHVTYSIVGSDTALYEVGVQIVNWPSGDIEHNLDYVLAEDFQDALKAMNSYLEKISDDEYSYSVESIKKLTSEIFMTKQGSESLALTLK